MKIDALTVGAVAFAGFAAYQFLKRPATIAGAPNDASQVYGMLTGQRQQVGGAVKQNTDYLAGWNTFALWNKDAPTGEGGFYGLKV